MQGRGQKFQNHSLWRNHLGSVWAPKKNLLTFHSTGWLIGILLMVYYNIYITGLYNPLYNLTNQGPFFHCSFKSSFFGWRFPRKLLRILTRILTAALTKTDSFREIRPSTKINMPDPIPPSQTLQIPLIFLGAFVNGTDFFCFYFALLVLPKYIFPVRLKHQLSHGHSPVRPNTRPKSFERSNKGLNNREQKHDWKTPIDGTWSGFQETPGRKDDETHSNNLETSQKSQFCKEMTFFKPTICQISMCQISMDLWFNNGHLQKNRASDFPHGQPGFDSDVANIPREDFLTWLFSISNQPSKISRLKKKQVWLGKSGPNQKLQHFFKPSCFGMCRNTKFRTPSKFVQAIHTHISEQAHPFQPEVSKRWKINFVRHHPGVWSHGSKQVEVSWQFGVISCEFQQPIHSLKLT